MGTRGTLITDRSGHWQPRLIHWCTSSTDQSLLVRPFAAAAGTLKCFGSSGTFSSQGAPVICFTSTESQPVSSWMSTPRPTATWSSGDVLFLLLLLVLLLLLL